MTGDVSHCSSPARISPQQSHNEDALLGLFIGLSVIACLIVSLILVILVILLKRTAAKNTGTKRSIATLQRKLFGRKNSQADEDPLPVVLLSYKADYDESLPAILQGLFFIDVTDVTFQRVNVLKSAPKTFVLIVFPRQFLTDQSAFEFLLMFCY